MSCLLTFIRPNWRTENIEEQWTHDVDVGMNQIKHTSSLVPTSYNLTSQSAPNSLAPGSRWPHQCTCTRTASVFATGQWSCGEVSQCENIKRDNQIFAHWHFFSPAPRYIPDSCQSLNQQQHNLNCVGTGEKGDGRGRTGWGGGELVVWD